MLSAFNKPYIFNYLIGGIFIIVCWLPTYFLPADKLTTEIFQYDTLLKTGLTNIYLLITAGLIFSLISMLFLNQLATEFGITGKLMTYGILVYSFLSVAFTPFTFTNPFLLVNFFLFFFVRNIYRLPEMANTLPSVFNASVLLSLASLYYFPIALLLPLLWIGLQIHRINAWRNYAASVAGFSTPYLFLITWYFWSDQLNDFLLHLRVVSAIGFNMGYLTLSTMESIIFILLSILILISLFLTFTHLSEQNINLRRNLTFTFYMLLFTLLLVLFFGSGFSTLLITVIPSGLLVSHALSNLKKTRMFNISLSIITLLILAVQYLKLFNF